MKHPLATIALLTLSVFCGPAIAAPAVTEGGAFTLPASQQWDMKASGSGRQYRIFAAWPEKPAPASGYRVLYVMDGNAMFLTAVEAVRAKSGDRPRGQGQSQQEMENALTVVIGVGYPPGYDISVERAIDLSLPRVKEPRVPAGSGGSDAFLDFMEKDLKPLVEGKFPIDRNRQAILGHSLGGLFVLHALATRPESFQTYLAASPSIWYANRAIKREIDAFAAGRANPSPPVRALLMASQYEQELEPGERGKPGAEQRAADLKARGQVDNGRAVAAQLDGLPNVDAEFVEFLGENHGSVVPASISRGIGYMMAWTAPAVVVPAMPTAQEYLQMTAEQRYQLRVQVRGLPEAERIPWVTGLYRVLHDGLTKEQLDALHEERNSMDQRLGTKPHLNNARLDDK